MKQKIAFVQFGDYGEAHARLKNGGAETYGHQKYSVDYVDRLADRFAVHVFATVPVGAPAETRRLRPGLAASTHPGEWDFTAQLSDFDPDLLVLRTPLVAPCAWAAARGAPVLPLFADYFRPGGPRAWLRNRRMARALKAASPKLVANHQVAASRTLHDVLSMPLEAVVAWDWPAPPMDAAPRRRTDGSWRLFYAGALTREKGVFELVDAVAALRAEGRPATAEIAGAGDADGLAAHIAAQGVAEHVTLLGLVPHARIPALMRAADLVVVPSRPEFPEGFPMVITEALATRTPLALSDHPVFTARLRDGRGVRFFAAGDGAALARTATRMLADPAEWEALSDGTATAAPPSGAVEWSTLLDRFLDDPTCATGWPHEMSLAANG